MEYYSFATRKEKSSFDYDCLVYFLKIIIIIYPHTFLDLLNHNNDYNSWFYYDEKRDGFTLISYGKFNNIYLYSM